MIPLEKEGCSRHHPGFYCPWTLGVMLPRIDLSSPMDQILPIDPFSPSQYYDCITCGACCAHFRVSFYSGETDFHTVHGVPVELVESISPFRVSMRGTNSQSPHCVALIGKIGEKVSCGIYANRSSACRTFEAGSEGCVSARIAHGIDFETQDVA